MKTITLEVSEREAALISICRALGNGTLEKVGVVGGQPSVVVASVQRIDLQRPEELKAVLEGVVVPVPSQANGSGGA